MIEVDKLSLSYKNENNILENVSLSIDANTTFLLGKNGSGKSTFLKYLSQTENLCSTGTLKLSGVDVSSLEQKELSSKISLLLQESISSDIYVNDIYKISTQFSKNPLNDVTVTSIKKSFNIDDLDSKNLNKLSGGEKQKVLITSFLIYNADILLFDEPFTAIDFSSTALFIEILKKYFKRSQKVVSIHDLNYIYCIKAPILFITDKKIVSFKNVYEFVKSDTYKMHYASIKYREENEKIHFYF